MVKSRERYPTNPDEMVAVRTWIPAKYRMAYDEESLRGHLSKDVRTALAAKFQNNGYGGEAKRQRYEQARETFFTAQVELEASKADYYGWLEKSLAHQKQGLAEDKEKELIEETLATVRDRYATRQRDLARAQASAKDAKKQNLDWCGKQIRDTPLLKERFSTPDALLNELERK